MSEQLSNILSFSVNDASQRAVLEEELRRVQNKDEDIVSADLFRRLVLEQLLKTGTVSGEMLIQNIEKKGDAAAGAARDGIDQAMLFAARLLADENPEPSPDTGAKTNNSVRGKK